MIRFSSEASWVTSVGFTSRQSHSEANAKDGVPDIELAGVWRREATNSASERGERNTNSSANLIGLKLGFVEFGRDDRRHLDSPATPPLQSWVFHSKIRLLEEIFD